MNIVINVFIFFILIPLLLNIEMETHYHSNFTFLHASKYKN